MRQLIGLLFLAVLLRGQAFYSICQQLPPPSFSAPVGAPAAPGDSFCSSFLGVSSANAPVISGWNASTGPNQAMALTGKGFSSQVGALLGTDTAVWISNGATVQQGQILNIPNPTTLTMVVPTGYSYGMYFVWVQNASGTSVPVAINRADAEWLGPLGSTTTSGATMRVFGKDLSTGHGTTTAYVYIQPTGGGSLTSATVTSVNPYAVVFTVPSLSNGTYNVYAHNGHGGAWGWSQPLVMTIATPFTRGAGSTTVSASGGDDAAAINAAIVTENGLTNGGTVNLNTGTYTIKAAAIQLLANVNLKGAGSGSTNLNIALTASGIQTAIRIVGDNTELQGLTITYINNGTTQAPGFIGGSNSGTAPASNTVWNDVIWTANDTGGSPENLGVFFTASGLEITNCVFYRDFAPGYGDVWIHGSTFYGGEYLGTGSGTEAAIAFQGIQRVTLENNTFTTTANPPVAGNNIVRRMFYGTVGVASLQNLYIANNTGNNVYPGQNENKGEIMLFHGAGNDWYGQAVSTSGNTTTVLTNGLINGQSLTLNNYGSASYSGVITDPLFTNNVGGQPLTLPRSGFTGSVGMFVSIVGGTGTGQLRAIASSTSNTVTVATPWLVPPDSTSILVLGYEYVNVVLYDNTVTAFPSGTWTNSGASILIDFDGNTWFSVADGNSVSRSFGCALASADTQNQSDWNIVENTTCTNLLGNTGISTYYWSNYTNGQTAVMLGPATLGNVFRGNSVAVITPSASNPPQNLDAFYEYGTYGGTWQAGNVTAPFPWHESIVFEDNTGTGTRIGMWCGEYADTVVRLNNLTVSDSVSMAPNPVYIRGAATPVFAANTYSGGSPVYVVESTFAYASPFKPSFSAVYATLLFGNNTGTIQSPLLRGGITNANYTASANQAWITPTSSGTINAEQTGSFSVGLSSTGLSAGVHTGLISISDGTNTFDMGVSLFVSSGPITINSGISMSGGITVN